MTPNPFTRTTGKPRDPARIDIIIAALRAYWLANPDLRLGQIVVNAADGCDPFGVEDDALMAGWLDQARVRAPRTCWDCRWADGTGCDNTSRSVRAWTRANTDLTLMPIPTATPCPGFGDKP